MQLRQVLRIPVATKSAKDCNVHEYSTSAIPVASSGPTVRSPRLPTLNVLLTAQLAPLDQANAPGRQTPLAGS